MNGANPGEKITKEELERRIKARECIACAKLFVRGGNVHTELGWKETYISGMCEDCFDACCNDEED